MLNFTSVIKKNKIFILFTLGLVTLVILDALFHKQISFILTKEISKEIKRRDLDVKFSTADFGYLPPRVIINDIHFNRKNLKLKAENISLSAQLIPLIKAKFVPNKLSIKTAVINIKSKKNDSLKDNKLDLKFDHLHELIPLSAIELENSTIDVSFNKTLYKFAKTDLELHKKTRSIDFSIRSKSTVNHPKHQDSFDLNVSLSLDKDSLYLRYANVQKENSILNLSGSVKSKLLTELSNLNLKLKNLYTYVNELRMNATIDLADTSDLIKSLSQKKNDSSGLLLLTSYFNEYAKEDKNSLNIVAKSIDTPFIQFNEVKIEADIYPEKIVIGPTNVKLTKDSELKSKGAVIKKEKETYWLSGSLESENVNFEDILASLNGGKVDLTMPLKLKTNCVGSVFPTLGLSCKGKTTVKGFDLNIKDKNFLNLNGIDTKFNTKITSKELYFSSNLVSIKDDSSRAKAEGYIHYIKGFDINFESKSFNLNLFNSIAGQQIKGVISGKGHTKGSSKWGVLDIDITDSKNVQFNEFYLGKLEGLLSYKFPYFKVSDFKGQVSSTDSYSGNFFIDTKNNTLSLSIEGAEADDASIRLLFNDLFSFPDSIAFTKLNYNFNLSGPLDIKKSNLNLTSQFESINFYGESFQRASVNLSGTDGVWRFNDTFFKKKNSQVNAVGLVKGFKEINIDLNSSDLKLENINKLNELNLKLSGDVDFQLNAEGPIAGPAALGKIKLTNTQGINDKNLGNSKIDFRLFEDQVTFSGEAFQKAIQGSGSYPLNKKGEMAFNGEVENLDIFSLAEFNKDAVTLYFLPLSFKSDFKVNFLDGKVTTTGWIEHFKMTLRNVNETMIKLSTVRRADLTAENVEFDLISKGNRKTDLKFDFSKPNGIGVNLNGGAKANSLIAFIPSTEIFDGDIEFKDVSLFFTQKQLIQSGTIIFKNGVFKTKDFPYSFSDLNSNFVLQNNKILIKKAQSRLNNSILKGSGYLNTSPFKLNLSITFKDLNLLYPEGINSFSSGEINIQGSELPLNTKGLIEIEKGQFTKDLLTSADGKMISVNRFLPKEVLYENSPPFNLDVLLKISEKYKVKSSEINGNVKGSLRLKGSAYNPKSVGALELINEMKISFLDKVFTVQEGRLNYDNYELDNPFIYVDATSDVYDSNDIQNKKYNVRMLVKGMAKDPNISFTSQPPLGEKEIISLLTLGTVSTQTVGQEINTQQQATYSGLQLGSFLIQKNKAIRELQEKTGTEIGISSSVDALSVNPKVQLKKKWSPKMSSTVSQSFGNQQVLSLSTEYNVNKNVSTSINVRNNQTQDASQLINRRVQQGEIFGIDLQYKFEFD